MRIENILRACPLVQGNIANNIEQFSGKPEVGTDVPYDPNIRKEKVDRPTYVGFWENKKKIEGGGKISKSSVVLIIIVSDLRNRMALSDFENSKYFTSYGQFKLKFSWKTGFFSLKKVKKKFKNRVWHWLS